MKHVPGSSPGLLKLLQACERGYVKGAKPDVVDVVDVVDGVEQGFFFPEGFTFEMGEEAVALMEQDEAVKN